MTQAISDVPNWVQNGVWRPQLNRIPQFELETLETASKRFQEATRGFNALRFKGWWEMRIHFHPNPLLLPPYVKRKYVRRKK